MYTVGLVPSPGVAHEHVTKIIPKVKRLLSQRINDDSQWNFDVKEDLIIGSAEDVHESVDKAEQIKNEKNWDFAICVTDLPSISGKRVVVSDFDNDKQVAMLSLPSLGTIDLKRKLISSITTMIEQLYYNEPLKKPSTHPLIHLRSVEPAEDESAKRRYINTLMLISWIQLICGLTRANKPWKNVFNLKKNYFCSLCDWNICLNFFNAMGTQCYLFTIKIYYLNDYINSWDGRLAFLRP